MRTVTSKLAMIVAALLIGVGLATLSPTGFAVAATSPPCENGQPREAGTMLLCVPKDCTLSSPDNVNYAITCTKDGKTFTVWVRGRSVAAFSPACEGQIWTLGTIDLCVPDECHNANVPSNNYTRVTCPPYKDPPDFDIRVSTD